MRDVWNYLLMSVKEVFIIKININCVFRNIRTIPVICVVTSVFIPVHIKFKWCRPSDRNGWQHIKTEYTDYGLSGGKSIKINNTSYLIELYLIWYIFITQGRYWLLNLIANWVNLPNSMIFLADFRVPCRETKSVKEFDLQYMCV